MANNPSRFGLKLAGTVLVLAVVGLVAAYLLRSVAVVALVKRQPAPDAKPGSVIVLAERETDLKCAYSGRILRSVLLPGKQIKEGEFLVQLDTRELELDIQKTASDLESQEKRIAVGSPTDSQIISAREELAGKERLWKLGSLAESEYILQQRAVKQLEQRRDLEKIEDQEKLDGLKNALSTKRLQLEGMTLTAPFDGVVSEVLANKDDIIGANAPIAHLITTRRIVEAKISEEDFADIKVGQKASVRFLTYGDPPSNATVTKILPTADPATQRYIVYLDVDIDPVKLVPGITGEVSITVGVHENTLTVPRRAVSGSSVYVVRDGRIELQKVELGYVSLNEVEILSGLKEGEPVIVEQLDRFRPGDHVRMEIEK
jgi:RND family efflux transporter MFP subunit